MSLKKYLQVNFKKIKLHFYGTLRTVAESFFISYILIENHPAKCAGSEPFSSTSNL